MIHLSIADQDCPWRLKPEGRNGAPATLQVKDAE
jgi:hypothetical protein